jgi:hypothetical protein
VPYSENFRCCFWALGRKAFVSTVLHPELGTISV